MSTALDLREGAIFAQQFKVVRPLAKGGMGAVYVVEQLGTKRERALKLMHPMLVSDERSRERFEREAQVSARIESDHVVEVIAAGVEPGSGTPWLCMELLRGRELSARMAEGPLARDEILEVTRQLGHALGAAHAAGIVHRDLKPENLFLATARRDGAPFTLKVLDFGVAALVHEASGKSTATQGVGSPLWMAPEQTNVGNVRPATDVWAVGLLAYHFLTGSFYWKAASREGSTLTALLVEVMVEPLVPASERAAEQGHAAAIPRGFDAWFARCVAREPTARFPEAGAAIAELVAVLGGLTPSMAPATAPQALAATMAVSTSPLGGTGPAAPSTPQTRAAPPTPPAPEAIREVVAAAPPGGAASAAAARSRPPVWAWILGALLVALSAAVGGVGYVVLRGAETVAAVESARPSARLELVGADGERATVTSTATAPAPANAAEAHGGAASTPPPEHAAHDEDAATTASAEAAPGEEAPVAAASASGTAGGAAEPAAPTTRRRPRGDARSASPTTRLLRARLDRCVQGNLLGEPAARWTFTLLFNRFGLADGARIEGPHAGEMSRYRTFRACVQNDLAGFDSGGDAGPFTLTLP